MKPGFTEGKYYVSTGNGESWSDIEGPFDTAEQGVEQLAELCSEWSSPEMLHSCVLTYFHNNQLHLAKDDQGCPINGQQISMGNSILKDGVIIWEPAQPKAIKTVSLPTPPGHDHHQYDENCEGCQPAMCDAITQKPLPDNHPNVIAIRTAFKEKCSDTQRRGWHKVVMGQSDNIIDKGLFEQACEIMLDALHKSVKSYQPGEQ